MYTDDLGESQGQTHSSSALVLHVPERCEMGRCSLTALLETGSEQGGWKQGSEE